MIFWVLSPIKMGTYFSQRWAWIQLIRHGWPPIPTNPGFDCRSFSKIHHSYTVRNNLWFASMAISLYLCWQLQKLLALTFFPKHLHGSHLGSMKDHLQMPWLWRQWSGSQLDFTKALVGTWPRRDKPQTWIWGSKSMWVCQIPIVGNSSPKMIVIFRKSWCQFGQFFTPFWFQTLLDDMTGVIDRIDKAVSLWNARLWEH